MRLSQHPEINKKSFKKKKRKRERDTVKKLHILYMNFTEISDFGQVNSAWLGQILSSPDKAKRSEQKFQQLPTAVQCWIQPS